MLGARPSQRRGRPAGSFLRDGSRQRLAILAVLIATAAFAGGSYRPTVASLILLRPLLVLGIGLMAVLPGPWDWRGLKVLLALLTLFALTMVIQLIPLPPSWWGALPGHDRYAGIVALTPQVWRPISLVPDLTINSLLALLPAMAVLIAYAGMNARDRWNTVWVLTGLVLGSAIIGLIQATGGNGPAALVAPSDEGVVTGFLANRNHGAVLLATAMPVVAILLRSSRLELIGRWLALGAAFSRVSFTFFSSIVEVKHVI